MSPLLAYIILIAMAISCFVGGNFCAPGPAQQGLVGLGGLLVGLVGPHLPSVLSSIGGEKLPKSSPNTPVVCLLALGSLLLASSCSSAKPTPDDGMRIAVQCAQTACDSVPPGPCERLIASAISCLMSAGNTAVCLGGVPDLVQVGYADLVCVVDALAIAHDDKQIRESANKWMRTQNVDVIR